MSGGVKVNIPFHILPFFSSVIPFEMASPSPIIDLSAQLDYYAIRDALLTLVKEDLERALTLASTCRHADALWLTQVFDGKDVKTPEDAINPPKR